MALRSTRATRPLARVRYQKALPPTATVVGTTPVVTGASRPDRVSSGQPATLTTTPSVRTRRAGRSWVSSQAGARSPRTIDAVEAVLASTHDPAATVTVRQHGVAGSPVAGSTRWWTGVPPRVQCRLPTPEVASPPEWIDHRGGGVRVTADVGHADGEALGRRTSDSHVAAERHQGAATELIRRSTIAARSAAQALAVAPRSRSVPAGMVTVPWTASSTTDRQPGTGSGPGRVPSTPPAISAKSRS